MKIKYLGHSAFELALDAGKKLVLDPYTAGSFGGALRYGPIKGNYDIAVSSHDHDDHYSREVVRRAKAVMEKAGRFEQAGVRIEMVPVFHDEKKGSERGKNLIAVIEAEGMRIAHLGDLGHAITPKDVPALAGVDVMMIPVGGHFTIDAKTACAVVASFAPKLVIPMHYRTAKCSFPITPPEDFTKLMKTVEKALKSEIELTKASLPPATKVIVLDPAN